MDSEGLLLLSDEPGINNRLLDPKAGHPRTYMVQLEGIPTPQALSSLERGGLEIQGYRTRPCRVNMPDPQPVVSPREPPVRFRLSIPTTWVELTLTEGKNRQVRRMTAVVGFPTLRLIRVAIGGLRIEGLEAGTMKVLNPAEVRSIWRG
jgi:23S rRNA pseudouridine2457 synthase